jgi:hypothetical protein
MKQPTKLLARGRRSAVKTTTRIIRKEERAGATTIVGCGAASAQAGV